MRRYIMLVSCTFMLWISGISIVHADNAVVGIIRSDNSMLKEPVPSDQPLSVEQIEDMVRTAVQSVGGLEQVLKPDAKAVVIKPNIVEVKRSGDGTITDWRVVRAIARIAHEIAPNAKVKVVECCNWDRPDTDWKQDGWDYAGYRSLETEPYIELVNMNYDSTLTRTIPGGGTVRDEYTVPETMTQADCFINVPVVKIIGWSA